MVVIMKRNTIQHKLVQEAVIELANHSTAEAVAGYIRQKYPNISVGTVYRNLNLLATEGEIAKITVPDSADRFDHILKEHYHMRCSKCNNFFDIDIAYIKDIDEKVESLTGFKLHGHEILFNGICNECKNSIV